MDKTHKCCQKQKLRRGLWSPDEDEKLLACITKHGPGSWSSVPMLAGIQRCGKSCRLRWINYLRPDLKRGGFSAAEEKRIIELHAVFGNKWSKIASHLPGRTDNEIKNMWNSCLQKRVERKSAQCKKARGIAENAGSNSCTPWPIFAFSQEDYLATEQSKRDFSLEITPDQALINKHQTIIAHKLQQLSPNPVSIGTNHVLNANNMPKQESDQELISIDHLLVSNNLPRLETNQVLTNNIDPEIKVLQAHTSATNQADYVYYITPSDINQVLVNRDQEIKALQVQKSATNQADYVFYITPPEINQLEQREDLALIPHQLGFDPLIRDNYNHPFPATNYQNSLEMRHQHDPFFAGLGMHCGCHKLCQLGSSNQSACTTCSEDEISSTNITSLLDCQLGCINQSASTTCSEDDSSINIPSLLDYQDVNFWFEEASNSSAYYEF